MVLSAVRGAFVRSRGVRRTPPFSSVELCCLVLLLPCSVAGCMTVLGGVIGGSVDREQYEAKTSTADLQQGDRLRVVLQSGSTLEGWYAGSERSTNQKERYLLLQFKPPGRVGAESRRIPTSTIRGIGVWQPRGHGWLYGALIGLSVDAASLLVINSGSFAPAEQSR